jgi:hypothetical protein
MKFIMGLYTGESFANASILSHHGMFLQIEYLCEIQNKRLNIYTN